MFRIRDWDKFQHFKDRKPPWVKLYRDILDDPDWHELDNESAKVLVMLWLLASEDDKQEGNLPSLRKMSFRLRMSEARLTACLLKLSHWVIQDDINPISSVYHVAIPETETETYKEETETYRKETERACEEFWSEYPRKDGSKAKAIEILVKLLKEGNDYDAIIRGVRAYRAACERARTERRYIAHATTWLNQRRWESDYSSEPDIKPKGKGDIAREHSARAVEELKRERGIF